MVNTFKLTEADLRPHTLNREETVRLLFRKASEFMDAAMLELGLKLDAGKRQDIEMALLEDFIEVHNYALGHHIPLPEAKSKIEELIKFKKAGHDIS